jgi:hypothetical protein
LKLYILNAGVSLSSTIGAFSANQWRQGTKQFPRTIPVHASSGWTYWSQRTTRYSYIKKSWKNINEHLFQDQTGQQDHRVTQAQEEKQENPDKWAAMDKQVQGDCLVYPEKT